jgi:hypothetical protein
MTTRRTTEMEMTPDLTVIYERLVRAAQRDLRRRKIRWRVSAASAVLLLSTAGAAAAVGLGWVQVGSFRISTQPELPASLASVPAASVLAGDPNALACGAGWVAATAVMQSPHDPGAIAGCHTPTDAERVARRNEMLAQDPSLAMPLPYWYRIDEQSLAATEGRPGAAAAIGPVYVGSATPLTPDELTDPANWRITVSGVDDLRVPTAPLPALVPAETGASTTGPSGGQTLDGCTYNVFTIHPSANGRPTTVTSRCAHRPAGTP